MNLHIVPSKTGWKLRKGFSKRTSATFKLRRDAIASAKKLAVSPDVIYVHDSAGSIVVRIPELRLARPTRPAKIVAVIRITKADVMTERGRKDIATWLRKHATDLVKQGSKYATNFRARYLTS